MKQKLFSTIVGLLFVVLTNAQGPRNPSSSASHDRAFYTSVKAWFAAWELMRRDVLHVHHTAPADFVFFDDRYLYTTAALSAPAGTPVPGPRWSTARLSWKRQALRDSITLPDHQVVPLSLMSFTAQDKKGRPFFVMPLPSFWEKAGVSRKELGDLNLYTGVFLHEFSHSQQMQNFGRTMNKLEQDNLLGVDFNDDVVQTIFQKDSLYVSYYRSELSYFYEAACSTRPDSTRFWLQKGLGALKQRQQTFFVGTYKGLKEIDNFFLTMEGLGQYLMYAWLTNPKGANLSKEKTLAGVRRGGRRWSQDEGLALFLILVKRKAPSTWGREMFGTKTVSIVQLLHSMDEEMRSEGPGH
jgi:hypothetical protein